MRKIVLACCLLATPTPALADYVCARVPTSDAMACFKRFSAAVNAKPYNQAAVDAFFDSKPTSSYEGNPAHDTDAAQARGEALREQGWVASRVDRLATPCLSYGVCR